MKRLKIVEHVVEEILDTRDDARVNDDVLYLYVCEHFDVDTSSITLKDFLTNRKGINCPAFETVRRTRQKVFEKRPELKPERITRTRESIREVFIDYALN